MNALIPSYAGENRVSGGVTTDIRKPPVVYDKGIASNYHKKQEAVLMNSSSLSHSVP